MGSRRETAQKIASRAGDLAVSTVGNAAGATVAPGTAVSKLRTKATSPGVLALVASAAVAFLLGRRSALRTGA